VNSCIKEVPLRADLKRANCVCARLVSDGSTLYKSIKGKGRSDAPIYAMLARVQMGDPPILILNTEKALGGQVNVIFGIEPNQP
jgi:hypothetical protein